MTGRVPGWVLAALYQEVARWKIPGGEGRFIAVGPAPSAEELRRPDPRH